MPRIYEHAIFGGNELRHEGCAPRCCEVAAEIVRGTPTEICGGCGGELREAPRPMDFDRLQACEQHAGAHRACNSDAILLRGPAAAPSPVGGAR